MATNKQRNFIPLKNRLNSQWLDDTLINKVQSYVFISADTVNLFFFEAGFDIFAPQIKGVDMAKQQSFSDKLKKKKKSDLITVKFIKSMKTAGGNYKFNEKFVQLEDLNKLSEVKWSDNFSNFKPSTRWIFKLSIAFFIYSSYLRR